MYFFLHIGHITSLYVLIKISIPLCNLFPQTTSFSLRVHFSHRISAYFRPFFIQNHILFAHIIGASIFNPPCIFAHIYIKYLVASNSMSRHSSNDCSCKHGSHFPHYSRKKHSHIFSKSAHKPA